MTDFISHYYIKVHVYVAFDHMRITGFHMYTMFVCLITSHDDELIKVVFTHPKQALLWTLSLFTRFHLQFTSVESFHFALNRSVHVYSYYTPFWQIRIILRITKTRTNNKFDCYSCYLVLIYAVCFKLGTHGATQLVSQKLT